MEGEHIVVSLECKIDLFAPLPRGRLYLTVTITSCGERRPRPASQNKIKKRFFRNARSLPPSYGGGRELSLGRGRGRRDRKREREETPLERIDGVFFYALSSAAAAFAEPPVVPEGEGACGGGLKKEGKEGASAPSEVAASALALFDRLF